MNTWKKRRLPVPGPMLPPVPAVLLCVKGVGEIPDDIVICWTSPLNETPPQVAITIPPVSPVTKKANRAWEFIDLHREFTLNVPTTKIIRAFDILSFDDLSIEVTDKFTHVGLTRAPSELVKPPGVAECAIILECRVLDIHDLPPIRKLVTAEVLLTKVDDGVCDIAGRLNAKSVPFFGMAAGSGEYYTLDSRVGHIGMTRGIETIRY